MEDINKLLDTCFERKNLERDTIATFLTSEFYNKNDLPELQQHLELVNSRNEKKKLLRVVILYSFLARLDTLHDFCDQRRTKVPEIAVFVKNLVFSTDYMRLMKLFLSSIAHASSLQRDEYEYFMSSFENLCNYSSNGFSTFEHAVIDFARFTRAHIFKEPVSELLNVIIADNHKGSDFNSQLKSNLELSSNDFDIVLETSHISLQALCDQDNQIRVVNSVASIYDKLGTTNKSSCLAGYKYVCNDLVLRRALGQSIEIDYFKGENTSVECTNPTKPNDIIYSLGYQGAQTPIQINSQDLESGFGVKLYATILYNFQSPNKPNNTLFRLQETFRTLFRLTSANVDQNCRTIFDLKRNGDWGIVEIAKNLQLSKQSTSLMTLDGPCYAKSLLTLVIEENKATFGLTSIFTLMQNKAYMMNMHKGSLTQTMRSNIQKEIDKWILIGGSGSAQMESNDLANLKKQILSTYINNILTLCKNLDTVLNFGDQLSSSYPVISYFKEVIANMYLKLIAYAKWVHNYVSPASTINSEFAVLMSQIMHKTTSDASLLSSNSDLHSFIEKNNLNEDSNELFFRSFYSVKHRVTTETEFLQHIQQDLLTANEIIADFTKSMIQICHFHMKDTIEEYIQRDGSLPLCSIVCDSMRLINSSMNWYRQQDMNSSKPLRHCGARFAFQNVSKEFLEYELARDTLAVENETYITRIISECSKASSRELSRVIEFVRRTKDNLEILIEKDRPSFKRKRSPENSRPRTERAGGGGDLGRTCDKLAREIINAFVLIPNAIPSFIMHAFTEQGKFSNQPKTPFPLSGHVQQDDVQTLIYIIDSMIADLPRIHDVKGLIRLKWYEINVIDNFMISCIKGRDASGAYVYIDPIKFCINMSLHQSYMSQVRSSMFSEAVLHVKRPLRTLGTRPMRASASIKKHMLTTRNDRSVNHPRESSRLPTEPKQKYQEKVTSSSRRHPITGEKVVSSNLIS